MDTMTISLNGIRLNSKNLRTIEQFLEEEVSTDVPDLTLPQKKSKKVRSVEQSVETASLPKIPDAEPVEPTNGEPEPEPEPELKNTSLEQIVNKTRELVQANKSAAVKKCLTKYEVSRVSDIPEEKYNDFYNDINNL